MWRNYFEYNGKRYYTGTVFVVKNIGSKAEAIFICYDTQHSLYVYKIGITTIHISDDIFWENFISLTDKINPNARLPIVKKRRELDIDGMFTGWTWYIALMLGSLIFKNVLTSWVFISIAFIVWRHEKINKEGTYIEW